MKPTSIATRPAGIYVYFTAIFPSKPSQDDVSDAQMEEGYHPCGYGTPGALTIDAVDVGGKKVWEAKWYCYRSCD